MASGGNGRGRGGVGGSVWNRYQPGPPAAAAAPPNHVPPPAVSNSHGGGPGRGGERGEYRGPRPEGRRGVRRQTPAERNDIVASKPPSYVGPTGKMGSTGEKVSLSANYFTLTSRLNWCIFNYRVDFKPEEDRTAVKKALLKQHAGVIGPYIFDGATLYTESRLNPEPLLLYSSREGDRQNFEVTIKFVQELAPGDVATIQFFNITLRKCLSAMKLEQVNRHFYDKAKAFNIEGLRLTIWPGYITSMRNYENNVLLCVEPTHKVLRIDSVLDFMNNFGNRRNPEVQQRIRDELERAIVVTSYNKKTYKVDGIDFSQTVSSGFEQTKDGMTKKVSYMQYYRERYGVVITDHHQPLLVSRRTKRDIHRGLTGDILLVPELCQMTGLSDEMRRNPGLMRQFADEMNMTPERRVERIHNFMRNLKSTAEARDDLQRWGLEFSNDLVSIPGRVIPQETILFDGGKFEAKDEPTRKADWTAAFRNQKLLRAPRLQSWVLIVSQKDSQGVENLISNMQRVTRTLNFPIDRPIEIMLTPDIRIPTYDATIRKAIDTYGRSKKLQMIFVVLPNDKPDLYGAVKRLCTLQYGIASQCFQSKHFRRPQGLMSIVTKCVVQMCAKLGGEPWTVHNPIKDPTMILGFDVHHSASRKGKSVGALVGTTSQNFSRYCSAVSIHQNREEISGSICQDVAKLLDAYMNMNNGTLPNRIIMYRDGVGEGQLSNVFDTELAQIKESIKGKYTGAKRPLPRLTFIVVTKRINTRIFKRDGRRHDNPVPGTCVDDVITKPESYDFYLVSQTCKQGTTVSPTSYNVLFDQQGVQPDTIQKLTYRLCHLYFNWSGCVAVPAPVQYAHRLAFQTGTYLEGTPSEQLSHVLHFL